MDRSYYMIDSIKGGCGKSTFAIMLADYLERKEIEGGNPFHTCLLDFDFLGTGLINIFLTETEINEFKSDYIFITDRIRDFQTEAEKYIYKWKTEKHCFFIGFGDPDYRSKQVYSLSSKFNYTPVVNLGGFRKGIQSIIGINDKDGKEISELESQISGKVKNIVMDMSPGMDSYSEAVKECFFDKRHSIALSDKCKTKYFLMTGMDPSHIAAAKSYFKMFVNSEDKIPDKIFIVINDPMCIAQKLAEKENMSEGEIYEAAVRKFTEKFELDDEYRKRICFIILNYFEEYVQLIHQQLPLSSRTEKEINEIFKGTPFKYWMQWDDSKIRLVVAEEIDKLHKRLVN